ncbi:MAG: hypothetical protein E7502_07630 [Ruminococcus sp.]|nr:hypothetical protein [Ruminococcus sp.]
MSKMKKMTALLTAFLCLNGSVFAIPANAAEVEDVFGKIYSYSTDTFSYTSNGDNGFILETELVDPDFMVVGIVTKQNEPEKITSYIVTTVNHNMGLGRMFEDVVDNELGMELQVGDLIKIEGNFEWLKIYPPVYLPCNYDPEDEKTSMIHLGNGKDVFGEEFEKVIRTQLVLEQMILDNETIRHPKLDLVKGDVNIDDEITIVDCLSLNRNLLLGEPMCDYAKAASDINGNGAPDSDDVLSILKECIEVTENFE